MPNKTMLTYRKIYKDYALKRSFLYDDIKKLLDTFIALLPGETVLDIGCAQGRESGYLAVSGLEVTGIDLTPEFIDLAKKNVPDATFKVMDMQNLKFGDDQFDGIWANASFLHIPKREALQTLKGFNKILKQSGIMHLSVFEGNTEGYHRNEKYDWDDRYFSDYSVGELLNLLSEANFSIISHELTITPSGKSFIHTLSRKN